MAISRSLQRLLRVRAAEEEQKRLALEEELGRLRQAEAGLDNCRERGRKARMLVRSGDPLDRAAAKAEADAAKRGAAAVERLRMVAERNANALRDEFRGKRVERMQAETLINSARKIEESENRRREQQALDDGQRARMTALRLSVRQVERQDEAGSAGEDENRDSHLTTF